MNHNDKELTTFVDTVKCLLERKIATIIHERDSAQEDLKKIYDMKHHRGENDGWREEAT